MTDLDALPRGLKLNDLGGLEIVAGRYRDHTLPRHSHDGLMLSLVRDGIQKVYYNGTSHYAGAG
ncbi:MAG: AraC family ligand binding domain-containing protein, partial [Paracoccus sp. (in: a-proteobacteria)]